jgi:hypothetical protein
MQWKVNWLLFNIVLAKVLIFVHSGSLRDAVSQPNRIVVFAVGGVITISNRIVVSDHVTIAGQTAPGGGITVYGNVS